jgi:hypothetical protein
MDSFRSGIALTHNRVVSILDVTPDSIEQANLLDPSSEKRWRQSVRYFGNSTSLSLARVDGSIL